MVHTQPCLCTCDQPYRAQVHLLQLDMQRDWLAISENVQNIVVFKTKCEVLNKVFSDALVTLNLVYDTSKY